MYFANIIIRGASSTKQPNYLIKGQISVDTREAFEGVFLVARTAMGVDESVNALASIFAFEIVSVNARHL